MDLSALIPTKDTIQVTFKAKVGVTEEDKPIYKTLTKSDGDPCTWTLWAPHTKKAKEVAYTRAIDKINSSRESKEEDVEKGLTLEEVQEFEDKRLQDIVDLTHSFDLEISGEPVEFSPEKAKEILEKAPKIVSTLEEAVSKEEGFI